MKKVVLIGAGNLGSRHLQGLAKVRFPLNIEVIDPSAESLKVSEERFKQIPTHTIHKINFSQNFEQLSENVDFAIIATNSNTRRMVIETLLKHSAVRYLLLEKILFQKKADYEAVGKLLKTKVEKTWVDFSMRTMPSYRELKGKPEGQIQMFVSGGQFSLITNAIHFLDYIAYLTGCNSYQIDTAGLDKKIIQSRRKGFLEINGTLTAHFSDGSTGVFSCYSEGNAPYTIELRSKNLYCISWESERKMRIAKASDGWAWKESESNIPFQSDMTNLITEEILKKGTSVLTPYEEASKTHLQLLEGVKKYLNKNSKKKYNYYPFT